MDVKTAFASKTGTDYTPVNYDGKFRGPVQIRFALGNSLNIPAVKMLAMVGLKDFLQKADDMGLHSFAPTPTNMNRFGLAVTLGGGESTLLDMTQAFSIFARGGTKKDIQSITEITDRDSKSMYKPENSSEQRVLSPESSFLISHILSDNVARTDEFGPNSYLRVAGKTVAVKTGTTDDKRDNWAIGYTKSVTVGVWVGNNDNSPMDQKIASGVTGASPIWHDIMLELLKKMPDGIMDKPDKVKAVEIDGYLGGLPKDGKPKRSEYFIDGTEPKDISPYYKKVKISKANGKLANDFEIRSGAYDEKDFIIISENDPISTDGKNRWQEAIDAWAKDQKDDIFHPPTDTSDANSDDVSVSFRSPNDKTTTSNDVNVKAKIISLSSIRNIKLYVNGSEKKNWDGDIKDIDEHFNLSDGTYELKIVARNDKDKTGDSSIKIGVNKKWDDAPPPTATPVPATPTSGH
jgi:membrane peptidoglycan carboxypeptidase